MKNHPPSLNAREERFENYLSMLSKELDHADRMGKKENCQVAVSLTLAHRLASLPVAFDLYLPKRWAYDWTRRKKAGVPREIRFRTKREIALAQIDAALIAGLPRGIVNADVAYGNDTDFRDDLTVRKLRYAVGIQTTTTVWPPGKRPPAPKSISDRGKQRKLLRRDEKHQPVTVRQLADKLGRDSFRQVTWREGAHGEMRSHFYARRVRPAHLDYRRETPRAEEWLLIEWPLAERDPTKYWFLTLRRQASLRKLVYTAKGRWPIERDYKDLKAVGLGDYEVRGWRGFHHHATMSIAAYAFLIRERGLFSLCRNRRTAGCALPRIYRGERSSRSANTSGAAQPNIACDDANRIGRCNGEACPPMSVLPKIQRSHVIIS